MRQSLHSFPIKPRQHIFNEEGIHIDFDPFEFDILGMEEGRGCLLFTSLTGAGQEVESEKFHIGSSIMVLYLLYVIVEQFHLEN